ncbi:MAG: hypothetical protein J5856_08395 [Lachnospiraceae bacterium]|nr:hypothetical protein [Lachnospiraceae bacterium]
MKKIKRKILSIICFSLLASSLVGCGSYTVTSDDNSKTVLLDSASPSSSTDKQIIAKAMDTAAFATGDITKWLDQLKISGITEASYFSENGSLYIVTDDDKSYLLLLTNRKVNGIQDLETGEWLMTSVR